MELDLTGLVLPEQVDVVERSDDERTAEFVMAPLERGFGHTLGNTVRRILLSSLRGSAVWAFQMGGVQHEHQSVSGVVEDVHQIIQNLKTLVLTMPEDRDDATLEFRAEKAGPVTARAVADTGTVEIINPDHHLFTLQDDREVNVVLRVNKGRGFVPAEQHELPEGSPVDLVRIDAIYNPVLRANFTVEETRVGQRTDFDRLTLLVETNGSVMPEDAAAYASELARKHLEYMLGFSEPAGPEPPVPGARRMPQPMEQLIRRPLEELTELSGRSVNTLKNEEITTVRDLLSQSEDQMLDISNFGVKSLEEIQRFLSDHELHFGMRVEDGEDGLYVVDPEHPAEEADEEIDAASETAEEEAE